MTGEAAIRGKRRSCEPEAGPRGGSANKRRRLGVKEGKGEARPRQVGRVVVCVARCPTNSPVSSDRHRMTTTNATSRLGCRGRGKGRTRMTANGPGWTIEKRACELRVSMCRRVLPLVEREGGAGERERSSPSKEPTTDDDETTTLGGWTLVAARDRRGTLEGTLERWWWLESSGCCSNQQPAASFG